MGTGPQAATAGCGAAPDAPRATAAPKAPVPQEAGDTAARSLGARVVDAPALDPVSAEAAAALKARGDAVFPAGDGLVYRGASAGLVIVELAGDGPKLYERAALYLPGAATDVVAAGDTAYVALGPVGVVAVDVRDPAAPRALALVETDGAALRLDLRGDRLLVADGAAGVLLLDVSDPGAPCPRGRWRSRGYVRHAIFDGERVLVADGREGVALLEPDRKSVV